MKTGDGLSRISPHELTGALSSYLKMERDIESLNESRTLALKQSQDASDVIMRFFTLLPDNFVIQFGGRAFLIDCHGQLMVRKVFMVGEVYPETMITLPLEELSS